MTSRALFVLSLLCVASVAVAESVSVEAVVTSGPAPQPAGPGQEVLAGLSATVLDPPVAQQQLTITGPEWSWELLSVEFRPTPQDPWLPADPERHQASLDHPHANSPDATLHALFIDEGECRLRARVTVRYGCPESGVQWLGEDDLTVDDLAVASTAPFLIVSSPAGCVPIDGPDVCNYADIYLIDRHGRIGTIGDLVITEDAGHCLYTIPFGSNTTSGQACLPPGTTAYCYNWSSGGFHNGPTTIAVEYVDQEGQPGQAAVAVQIRNLQIEAVVDDDHRPTLQWDPTDLAGEQGRTKARIRFRLRSACAGGVTILRKIYRIDQDSHNDPDPYFGWESYRFDECVVQVGDDWSQTVVQDWDWDGLVRSPEGGWEWAPKGLYAFDIEHDLSGSHDNKISRQLYSLYPETEQGQRQPRAELLGFEPLSGIFSFLVNYGLVGEHGCSLGYLHVVDPDFEHRIYDLADLHCRAHDANDGMSSWGANLRHRLEVPVPAEFLAKQGKYWFKVTVADNNPAGELAHRIKPPLEVGQYWTQIDLDIDSDNNNGYGPPDRTGEEDVAEDQNGGEPPATGKFVRPNLDDTDQDGIPDYADGFNWDGVPGSEDDTTANEQFVPIVLEAPDRIDPESVMVQLVYDAAPPSQVQRSGEAPNYAYQPGAGHLRLWLKDGSEARNGARIQDGGDWVSTDPLTAAQLGFDSGGGPVTLYLEAVAISSALADQRIRLLIDPDGGEGPENWEEYQDAVRCTLFEVDLDVDSDNTQCFEAPERNQLEDGLEDAEWKPGKVVPVNDDDSDEDGVPDYADGFNGDGIAGNADDVCSTEAFTPLVLELPPFADPAAATIEFAYDLAPTGTEPSGAARLWTKDGQTPRAAELVGDGGDLVPAGAAVSAAAYGYSAEVYSRTLYLEGVGLSSVAGECRIAVALDPDGAGPLPVLALDAVRCTVARLDSLEVNGAHRIGADDEWAASLKNDHWKVTVAPEFEPFIEAEQALGLVVVSGGEAVDGEPWSRTVDRATVGTTAITAVWCGAERSAIIHVVEVQALVVEAGAIPVDADNAVALADPSDQDGIIIRAVLNPDISPVPAQLLGWSGGLPVPDHAEKRQVCRRDPIREPLRCECGDSSADLTAWVVRLDLDLAGNDEQHEETQAVRVLINSDDDDCSGTEDPPYDGSDLQEAPVAGEDDLVTASVRVEPEGAGGVVTLSLSGAPGIGLHATHDKAGTLPGDLTWDLSSLWNGDPADDEPLPETLWVEGRAVSGAPGDQVLRAHYTWGVETEDAGRLTVAPRPGSSQAALRVHSAVEQSGQFSVGAERYAPLGGHAFVALVITVGPGERVDPAVDNVTVRIRDDWDGHTHPSNSRDVVVDLTTAAGWEKCLTVCGGGTLWTPSDTPPKADNAAGGAPVAYRYLIPWNTLTEPLGHNGAHSVAVVAVNGDPERTELEYQRYEPPNWGDAYTAGPTPKSADVANVVVTGIKTNVDEDYFAYDKESDDPSRQNPPIEFDIVDRGDPHQYRWVVYMRPTPSSDWKPDEYAVLWGILTFFANFVPYIGSMFAVALPILMAYVQFDSLILPITLLIILTTGQMVVGYLIEPRMIGRKLGVSPLMILLSLAFWGLLWGVPGMVLSAPLIVTVKIVLENIEQTRPIAMMMSSD